MKVKPYRVCDICNEKYNKTHGCMKIKMFRDPYGFCDMYGDLKIFSTMDVCPDCGRMLINVVRMAREDLRNDNKHTTSD